MQILMFITAIFIALLNFLVTIFPDLMFPAMSLFFSAVFCIIFIFAPTGTSLKRDILEPPRLLAILYLIFFPIFAFAYIHDERLAKWYPGAASIGSVDELARDVA